MKYVFGVLGIIFVVILAIVLISRGGGERQQAPRPVVVSEQNREGTSVQMTQQGKLVGEDERRSVRVTVTQNERRLEILTGYEEAIERSQVYANTPGAYETFLVALDKSGFNKRRAGDNDERSACPLGNRYVYELKEYSQDLIRLWDTTCGNNQGTFAGSKRTVRELFQEQIPDYDKQVQGVKLQ